MDTIYALSSGAAPSGVAVIRISGPKTKDILKLFIGLIPPPRRMIYRPLYRPSQQFGEDRSLLDKGLIVFFPKPHSFTGEDCAEFHLHGSRAVIELLFKELNLIKDCRAALAGEFTKRAFLHNRLDLTEAEALSDLLSAESEAQHRLALAGANGVLAAKYRNWREKLIKIRAFCEACFDFSEEEDLSLIAIDHIWPEIAALRDELKQHIKYGEELNKLRDGIKIALIGPPNAGKSSLINFLAQRKIAIVSDQAGTTRDSLELRLNIGGHIVIISDTAGLRDSEDKLEKLGIEQSWQKIAEADLLLFLQDLVNSDFGRQKQLEQQARLKAPLADIWHIGNKSDLLSKEQLTDITAFYDLVISNESGENLPLLLERLEQYVQSKCAKFGDLLPVRQRQIDLLQETIEQLNLALTLQSAGLEYSAEHLRLASEALGRITGDIDVEHILDIIFSQFCIGK